MWTVTGNPGVTYGNDARWRVRWTVISGDGTRTYGHTVGYTRRQYDAHALARVLNGHDVHPDEMPDRAPAPPID